MSYTHGVHTEVGRLRTVLTHRPGSELRRAAAMPSDRWLFHGLPWVGRAQQEHDALAECLRESAVEVLYVMELLQDCLEYPSAREAAITSVTCDPWLGAQLGSDVRRHLAGLDPEGLAAALVGGLAVAEFRGGRGFVYGLLGQHDFVVEPLPHLVFVTDSSIWAGQAVITAALPGDGRRRECDLMRVIYSHHPRFAGTQVLGPPRGLLHGGDVLRLAPGVAAVGISDRTSPAGVEHLAGLLLSAGLAQTVLAVPLGHLPAGTRLDTVCTVVTATSLLMSPALAYTLQACTITAGGQGLRATRPQPFLESVARAVGTPSVTVISTGTGAPCASRPTDETGNMLALGGGLVVCHERHAETNARLEAAGAEVIRVPCGELSSVRGGPRAMACAVTREVVTPACDGAPGLPLVAVPAVRETVADRGGELIPLAVSPVAAEQADLASAG